MAAPNNWRNDSLMWRWVESHPEVKSVFDLIDRAGEQLSAKQKDLKTLRDYEQLCKDQNSFLKVLRRSLDSLPHGLRDPFFQYNNVKELEDDWLIAESWIEWYKYRRAKWQRYINLVESDIPVYPDFEITEFRGKYPRFRVLANVPVIELKFRIRQAFVYFWMLYNIHCSPIPAPSPGGKLPHGPHMLNPKWHVKPRIPSNEFLFNPQHTIKDACIRIMKIYITSVVKLGVKSELLPSMVAKDHELSPNHRINSVKESGEVY